MPVPKGNPDHLEQAQATRQLRAAERHEAEARRLRSEAAERQERFLAYRAKREAEAGS